MQNNSIFGGYIYEKNIDDLFAYFISSVCQLNDHCKKPNGEYTYG